MATCWGPLRRSLGLERSRLEGASINPMNVVGSAARELNDACWALRREGARSQRAEYTSNHNRDPYVI